MDSRADRLIEHVALIEELYQSITAEQSNYAHVLC